MSLHMAINVNQAFICIYSLEQKYFHEWEIQNKTKQNKMFDFGSKENYVIYAQVFFFGFLLHFCYFVCFDHLIIYYFDLSTHYPKV